MPTYFDKNDLTPEQMANWDGAIIEYSRVQEENLERDFSKITQKERDYYAKQFGAMTDEAIRNKMRLFGSLTANPPGHPKSALFSRLLDGKKALPMPPPTSYSYPWYSVIEDAGPHRAMLGGALTLGSMLRGTGGANGLFGISINQSRWMVKRLNSAAQSLLDLDVELRGLSGPENPQDSNSSMRYTWTDDLLDRVKSAYAEGPELIVQHGEWPEFRLFVGQADDDCCHRAQKGHAKEKMHLKSHQLKHVHSVFDLDAIGLNARIGKTLSHGIHPTIRLQETKDRLGNQEKNPTSGLYLNLDQVLIESQLKSLEADVQKFEANPDNEDIVELFLDLWFLEKVA